MRKKKRILPLLLIFMLSVTLTSSLFTGNNNQRNIQSSKNFSEDTVFTGFEFPKVSEDFHSKDSMEVIAGEKYKGLKLYPGGVPFGVKFYTGGLLVIGFSDFRSNGTMVNPAYSSGLREKDIIKQVNGKDIYKSDQLTKVIDSSKGDEITLTYIRSGKVCKAHIRPEFSSDEGKFKTGLMIRDSGAGIGTVTYINPDTLEFGGLGHGICESNSYELVPMKKGSVLDVKISGLTKGVKGAPGEIKGYFNSSKTGTLTKNTNCGVYGYFTNCPENLPLEPMEIATRTQLKEGNAQIYCTLDEGGSKCYDIKISEINRNATGNKCFTIQITDKNLIEKSGGIIQGMSGSPIIQDGKLAGAVTHVLINDPTCGYGIFIENMLSSAN